MSVLVYSGPAPLYAYGVSLSRPVVITQFGQQNEQRSTRSGRTWRTWNFPWAGLTGQEKRAVDAFFVGQGGQATSFYWRDENPDADDPFFRYAIALGNSVAAQTVFALPSGTSEYAGDWPLADGHAVLRSDGTPVATTTAQTDARTLTAGAAPGAGHVMTADYLFYRRFRLDTPYSWARGEHGLWSTSAIFREVPQ